MWEMRKREEVVMDPLAFWLDQLGGKHRGGTRRAGAAWGSNTMSNQPLLQDASNSPSSRE